jgi:Tol biopolymer transport system component
LLLVLGVVWVGSAQAAYPGRNGRIAFVRAGNIYSIRPNGSGLQRLTNGGHDSGPRWSPSGQQIAYLFRGNLWLMAANGADKTQITHAAPRFTDARPSWSPNGRYLAFVETHRGHSFGYLTRYDTVTGGFVTFSVPYNSEQPTIRQIKVPALPDPVAWGWASNGSQFGSFILFEGAPIGEFCQPTRNCLDAIGWPQQNMYRNAFPSGEASTTKPIRLTDPDWFPISPLFSRDVLTSQESCTGLACAPLGIDLGITSPPVVPGAYEAVYSPVGRQIAYVLDHRGVPSIYIALNDASPTGTLLTTGTQPDWQPV